MDILPCKFFKNFVGHTEGSPRRIKVRFIKIKTVIAEDVVGETQIVADDSASGGKVAVHGAGIQDILTVSFTAPATGNYKVFLRAKGNVRGNFVSMDVKSNGLAVVLRDAHSLITELNWYGSPIFQSNADAEINVTITDSHTGAAVPQVLVDRLLIVRLEDVTVSFTDPLAPDTDGDGIRDGAESARDAYWFAAEDYAAPIQVLKNVAANNGMEVSAAGGNLLASFTQKVSPGTYQIYVRGRSLPGSRDAKIRADIFLGMMPPFSQVFDTVKTISGNRIYHYQWQVGQPFEVQSPLSVSVTVMAQGQDSPGVFLDGILLIKGDYVPVEHEVYPYYNGYPVDPNETYLKYPRMIVLDTPRSVSNPMDIDTDADGDRLAEGGLVGSVGYLTDGWENEIGTNSLDIDTDDDGMTDDIDWNPLSDDADNDGILDGIEDSNRNGVFDTAGETDFKDDDTDNDGILDGNEDRNCNGTADAGESNPRIQDTDSDGIQDGTEAGLSEPQGTGTETTDPNSPLGTFEEFVADEDPSTRTSATSQDTDSDGIKDGTEDPDHNGSRTAGESRADKTDSDHDGLSDKEETPGLYLDEDLYRRYIYWYEGELNLAVGAVSVEDDKANRSQLSGAYQRAAGRSGLGQLTHVAESDLPAGTWRVYVKARGKELGWRLRVIIFAVKGGASISLFDRTYDLAKDYRWMPAGEFTIESGWTVVIDTKCDNAQDEEVLVDKFFMMRTDEEASMTWWQIASRQVSDPNDWDTDGDEISDHFELYKTQRKTREGSTFDIPLVIWKEAFYGAYSASQLVNDIDARTCSPISPDELNRLYSVSYSVEPASTYHQYVRAKSFGQDFLVYRMDSPVKVYPDGTYRWYEAGEEVNDQAYTGYISTVDTLAVAYSPSRRLNLKVDKIAFVHKEAPLTSLSDVLDADTDGDGYSDSLELSDVFRVDTNGDGELDTYRSKKLTSPFLSDTDGDGFDDREELEIYQSDPVNENNWVGYFVTEDFWTKIKDDSPRGEPGLVKYASMVSEFSGIESRIYHANWADATALKQIIKSLHYKDNPSDTDFGMVGAVLVGDTPIARYYDPDDHNDPYPLKGSLPSNLFYMDLDGNWGDNQGTATEPDKPDGIFDSHTPGQGNVIPEIWVASLRPPTRDPAMIESDLRSYFSRAIGYMKGEWANPSRAMMFVTTQFQPNLKEEFPYTKWEMHFGFKEDYGRIDGVVDNGKEDSPYSDMMQALGNYSGIHYQFVSVDSHGSSAGHAWATMDTIRAYDIKHPFHVAFGCFVADYDEEAREGFNYFAGAQTFTGSRTLATIASSREGQPGFVRSHSFYKEVNKGYSLGTFFLAWWKGFAGEYEGNGLNGHHIIGDGCLRTHWKD